MTDKQEAPTTPEEKFFGISTPVENPDEGTAGAESEIEIVEAAPEAKPVEPPATPEGDGADMDDEELTGYSDRVQKRINKLTWKANDERRQREAAERMNDEAVRVTQSAVARSQQYEQIINTGEARLVQTIQERAQFAVSAAQEQYRKAYEEGDTDAIIKAQEAMLGANAEHREAGLYEQYYNTRAQQFAAQQQFRQQQPPQAPAPQVSKPTERSRQWAQDNPWFGTNEHTDMTALAYGVHEDLVRNKGIRPDSDEYFRAIDQTMRSKFPEYFEQGQGDGGKPPASTVQNPSTVVAPAGRNNGAKPRKVKLTPTARALAKRLGLTEQQYAAQALRDNQGTQI